MSFTPNNGTPEEWQEYFKKIDKEKIAKIQPNKIMTIKIIHINGYYVPDNDNISQVLFEHLYKPSESNNYNNLTDLSGFRILAKTHGWKIKVRKARKSDYEEDF